MDLFFDEGRASDKALLGGKGANLAEMTHLGLPIARRLYHYNSKLSTLFRNSLLFESILKKKF